METDLTQRIIGIGRDGLEWMGKLALPLAILVGAYLIVAAWRQSATGGEAFRERIERFGKSISSILIGTLLIALEIGILKVAIEWVDLRAKQKSNAEYRMQPEGDIGPVSQSGPAASYRESKQYVKTITLPSTVVDRLGEMGMQVFESYLRDPSATEVTDLTDQFKRRGRDVVITRTVTRNDQVPIGFRDANIKVNVVRRQESQPGERAFDLHFQGNYKFTNPLPTAARLRFVFPQPNHQGIVTGLKLTANQTVIREPSPNGTLEWEDEVPAGGSVTAVVEYQVQGSRTFAYDLASYQRQTQSFEMTLTSAMPVRIQRGNAIPVTVSGNSHTWKLQDVLTSNQIGVAFPITESGEYMRNKVLRFAPAALLGFWLGTLLLARLKKRRVGDDLIHGGLAIGSAYAIIAATAPYIRYEYSILIGGLVSVFLVLFAMRERGWPTAVIVAAAPLAFLTKVHAGIALTGLLVVWIIEAVNRSKSLSQVTKDER